MVYRRFGSVYSRLLLSKQDEMTRMEATLLAMDRTDQVDNNGHYLMSRPLDVEREQIPEAWEGQSRVKLLERMEKVALEYGKYLWPRKKTLSPTSPRRPRQLSICRTTILRPHIPRLHTFRGEDSLRSSKTTRRCTLPIHPTSSQHDSTC